MQSSKHCTCDKITYLRTMTMTMTTIRRIKNGTKPKASHTEPPVKPNKYIFMKISIIGSICRHVIKIISSCMCVCACVPACMRVIERIYVMRACACMYECACVRVRACVCVCMHDVHASMYNACMSVLFDEVIKYLY